jgi:O-antigen/teichoic acid export membrane protein
MKSRWQLADSDFTRKVVTAGTARAYTVVTGFVFLLLTARWLGPRGRGEVAVTITWVTLASTLGYLSLGQVAIHRASRATDQTWLGPVLGSILAVAGVASLTLVLISGAVFVVARDSFLKGIPVAAFVVGLAILPAMLWEQIGSALLMAVNRLDIYNRAQLVGRTAGLLALGLAIVADLGVTGVLLAALAGQVIVSSVGLRLLLRQAESRVRPDGTVVRGLLSDGARLHLAAVGAFLLTGVGTLVVNGYEGVDQAAFYQLGIQVIIVLWLIPQAANMVLYTKVASVPPAEVWGYQRRAVITITAAMTAVCLIAVVAARPLVVAIAGSHFAAAAPIVRTLLPALLAMTFASLIAPQWVAQGRFGDAAKITLAVGVLNVVLTLILVRASGAAGAALALSISYGVAVIPNLWIARGCERRYRVHAEGGVA